MSAASRRRAWRRRSERQQRAIPQYPPRLNLSGRRQAAVTEIAAKNVPWLITSATNLADAMFPRVCEQNS